MIEEKKEIIELVLYDENIGAYFCGINEVSAPYFIGEVKLARKFECDGVKFNKFISNPTTESLFSLNNNIGVFFELLKAQGIVTTIEKVEEND